jgi:hypothetical protein
MALSRITAASIADGTVVAADIADGAVTGPKLGATSINANNIVDSSITSGKIDTIANTQLTGTITTAQLGTGAVSNTKIASGAVEQYFADTGYETQFRNRIINGDCRIAQRGTAAVTASDDFPVDRFKMSNATDGAFSAIQDSSAPSGFINSLKWTVTTEDATIGADQYAVVRQIIEGNNCADLGWGAAGAKTVTLSFWVRSSVTGTFGGALRNADANRAYPFTYSISVADTWEYKTITVAGDTSGTWGTGTGAGITVFWSLAAGSNFAGTAGSWSANQYLGATGETNLMATLNATWYITGVQLEVGSVATPFERRPYTTELQLCQRYFQRNVLAENDYPFSSGYAYSTNGMAGYLPLAVAMRAQPTATIVVGMGLRGGGLGNQALSSLGSIYYSASASVIFCNPTTTGTNLTASTAYILVNNNPNSGFTLSAEL